jgi:sec-independent protein translocase protein TatA
MFGLGAPELIVIAVIILLLFGAKRLPGIGAGLGETLKEVRNVKKEIGGDKDSPSRGAGSDDSVSESNTIEGKLAESVQEKLTDKAVAHLPGIKQVKGIKSKAHKIKNIVHL